MKTGIFGGTFNPVHCGHVRLARHYMEGARLDRLLVIPTRMPPHKNAVDLLSGAQRMEMCRLAFGQMPGCQVSGLEMERPEKSYTVDTLEALHMQYPQDSLCLLMGSDMFLTMTHWKDWQRIFQLASLCVGARETDLDGRLEAEKIRLEQLGASCELIPMVPMEISSTEIRRRIADGQSVSGLVPEKVEAYILKYGLYQRKSSDLTAKGSR